MFTINTFRTLDLRLPLLCGLLFAAIHASQPISVRAQCANWDASGELAIFQHGIREPIKLNLEQKGRVISGRAVEEIDTGNFGLETHGGLVDGTIDGDSFSVQIFWPHDQIGVYNAKVLPSGR